MIEKRQKFFEFNKSDPRNGIKKSRGSRKKKLEYFCARHISEALNVVCLK